MSDSNTTESPLTREEREELRRYGVMEVESPKTRRVINSLLAQIDELEKQVLVEQSMHIKTGNQRNDALREVAALEKRLEAIATAKCGHHWQKAEFSGCPVCAMKEGTAVRIGDLTRRLEAAEEKP